MMAMQRAVLPGSAQVATGEGGGGGSVTLDLFNCSVLGRNARSEADCGQCVRQANVRYGCGWCTLAQDADQGQGQGAAATPSPPPPTCAAEQRCDAAAATATGAATAWSASVADCPRPTIASLSPVSGPVQGGTVLRIQGANLGRSQGDIAAVTVAGQ